MVEIETRLEVHEAGTEDSNPQPNNVGVVSWLLSNLKSFEYFGKQLNVDERRNDLQEREKKKMANGTLVSTWVYSIQI